MNLITKNKMMHTQMAPLISGTQLMEIKDDPTLVLIDARFGKNAREDYRTYHLEGGLYVHLNDDLSAIDNPAKGGRHPLISTEQLSALLTSLGISKNSHVVIYDITNGAMAAARFWWMLKSAGHEKVQVLNGGMQEAIQAGFSATDRSSIPKKTSAYEIGGWQLPLTTLAEVEKISEDKAHIVIDVRAKERYDGKVEPIDLIAGHIPGAINVPLTGNVDQNGMFLSSVALKTKYEAVFGEVPLENVTVHCGSGVTACHTLLALNHAGFEIPKLYVGSWSEWSRNNKPISTNE